MDELNFLLQFSDMSAHVGMQCRISYDTMHCTKYMLFFNGKLTLHCIDTYPGILYKESSPIKTAVQIRIHNTSEFQRIHFSCILTATLLSFTRSSSHRSHFPLDTLSCPSGIGIQYFLALLHFSSRPHFYALKKRFIYFISSFIVLTIY